MESLISADLPNPLGCVLCDLLLLTLPGLKIGVDDLQRFLPTSTMLWFCELVSGCAGQGEDGIQHCSLAGSLSDQLGLCPSPPACLNCS